jgi:hypothetical protein
VDPTIAAGASMRVNTLMQKRSIVMRRAHVDTTWTDILTALLIQGSIVLLLLLAR